MNGNHPATIPTPDATGTVGDVTDDQPQMPDDSMGDGSQMTITVPTELQAKVAGWQDGEDYQVTITQTAAGQYDLKSVDGGGAGDATAAMTPGPGPTNDTGPDQIRGGNMNDTAGTTIPSKNPSVAALIMLRRGKK